MSGPVLSDDVAATAQGQTAMDAPTFELTPSREAQVGGHRVRRALPRRGRRTVGAWCFADHMGPLAVTDDVRLGIGPHPHMGLQTVTWLIAGEIVHRDSLGSEETIRPGQLNLMTAGRGISHAEETTDQYRGDVHGIQLWIAQPEATRHGDPGFEHHAALPQLEIGNSVATVLVGGLADTWSTARRDTDHLGVDLQLRPGRTLLPVHADHEYTLVVLEGAVALGEERVVPGNLAYLGIGRDELRAHHNRRRPVVAARWRTVRVSDPHVVELRGPDACRGRPRPSRVE